MKTRRRGLSGPHDADKTGVFRLCRQRRNQLQQSTGMYTGRADLGGGNCRDAGPCNAIALKPPLGADTAGRDAGRMLRPRRQRRSNRTQITLSRVVSNLVEPYEAVAKSANRVQLYQPASYPLGRACQTYPYNPENPVQHPCALSDYNNGATLTRAGMVRTHLFHRICK